MVDPTTNVAKKPPQPWKGKPGGRVGAAAGGPAGRGGGGGSNAAARPHQPPPRRRKKPKRSSHHVDRGPPPAPQLKLTLFNLHNVEKYNSVAAIGELTRALVALGNEKLQATNTVSSTTTATAGASSSPLTTTTAMIAGGTHHQVRLWVDEESIRRVTVQDELVRQARLDWEAEQKGSNDIAETLVDGSTSSTTEPPAAASQPLDAAPVSAAVADHDAAPPPPPALTRSCQDVGVRLLYAVLPKRTKRRGIKPGTAYLVLSTAPITAAIATSDAASVQSSGGDNNSNNTNTTPTRQARPDYYTRDLARRRMLLNKARDVLQAACMELGHGELAPSYNGKTWKPTTTTADGSGGATAWQHRSRLDGTIWTTAHYQDFWQRGQSTAQARAARPRPPPGGGTTGGGSSKTTTDGGGATTTATLAGTELVSALVLHLRHQQELDQQRKKAKKVKAAKKENGGGGGSRKSKSESGTKTMSSKKKKSSDNKPKAAATSAAAAAAAPPKKKRSSKKRGGGGGGGKAKMADGRAAAPGAAGATAP